LDHVHHHLHDSKLNIQRPSIVNKSFSFDGVGWGTTYQVAHCLHNLTLIVSIQTRVRQHALIPRQQGLVHPHADLYVVEYDKQLNIF